VAPCGEAAIWLVAEKAGVSHAGDQFGAEWNERMSFPVGAWIAADIKAIFARGVAPTAAGDMALDIPPGKLEGKLKCIRPAVPRACVEINAGRVVLRMKKGFHEKRVRRIIVNRASVLISGKHAGTTVT